MIPTLFEASYIPPLNSSGNYPVYPLHGVIDLTDAVECYTKEVCDDDSVEWELEMRYPISGVGFGDLAVNKIILAKANDYQNPQAFRIYSIQRGIDKTVTVKAQHISYDLANVPMKQFKQDATKSSDTASAVHKVMATLRNNSLMETIIGPRHFYLKAEGRGTDKAVNNQKFELKEPKSMRAVLVDGDDSVRGTYGGDLVIDNYLIILYDAAGSDNGVTIEYGIDLVDMEQERNIGEMFTGVLPYYREQKDGDDEFTYGSIVYADGEFPIKKVQAIDFTSYFTKKPDTTAKLKEQLKTHAEKYIKKNGVGKPEITLKISYAYLKQPIKMFDVVRVYFPKMKVDTKAKVISYKYNVLLDRVEEIELGRARSSKYFRLMDASRLRKGYLPPDRVEKGSIRGGGGGHIAGGSITKEEITPMTIDGSLLARGAVSDTTKIANLAIKADNIDSEAVTAEKILKKCITGGQNGQLALGNDGVTTANIAANAVAFDQLTKKVQDGLVDIGWASR